MVARPAERSSPASTVISDVARVADAFEPAHQIPHRVANGRFASASLAFSSPAALDGVDFLGPVVVLEHHSVPTPVRAWPDFIAGFEHPSGGSDVLQCVLSVDEHGGPHAKRPFVQVAGD